MKFNITIEHDGNNFVAYCNNLIGCYAQSKTENSVKQLIQETISLYISNYEQRSEPFNPSSEEPQLNYQIRFKRFSAEQLRNILIKSNYVLDHITSNILLFRKIDFPFHRMAIPNINNLSPIIIKKIFGEANVTIVRTDRIRENVKYRQG